MNFDEAIQAHAGWKIKLNQYLSNPDGSINSQDLGKDNVCALGKWLHTEGLKYGHHAEYNQLVQDHAHFHKAAADIVIQKNKGENITADVALGSHSPFSKYSMSVVSLLWKMKTLAG